MQPERQRAVWKDRGLVNSGAVRANPVSKQFTICQVQNCKKIPRKFADNVFKEFYQKPLAKVSKRVFTFFSESSENPTRIS